MSGGNHRINPAVLEAWLDHPLVREAQHGLRDDADIVELFENLSGILNELDERFPGIPFRTIQQALHNEVEPETMHKILVKAGVNSDDASLVVLDPNARGLTPGVMNLIREDVPVSEWQRRGFDERSAQRLRALTLPITDAEMRILTLTEQGVSPIEASRRTGISKPTAYQAARKRKYQLWLEEHGGKAAQQLVALATAGDDLVMA